MNQLFKKAAIFGDIHYGYKNNSKIHNDDCDRFVDWFCDTAKKENCDVCIFLGDLNHNRNTINVSTINYGVNGLDKLSKSFKKVYIIIGNHDLYYREKRDLYSFPYANNYDNIEIINNIKIINDVALIPWLIDDEWKQIENIQAKYMFGHFELPHFKMNAMVEMPDHGGLKTEHFVKPEYVFSGHFHKRQNSGKIHYIGSPFAHNFADVWDNERGMVILEWDGVPRYIDWENGPRYITIALSALIDNPEEYLNDKTYCKISIDIPVSYEEANFIKDTLMDQYNLRELSLVPQKTDEHTVDWSKDNLVIENVDQIVVSQLTAVDSKFIDKDKLMEIYLSL